MPATVVMPAYVTPTAFSQPPAQQVARFRKGKGILWYFHRDACISSFFVRSGAYLAS